MVAATDMRGKSPSCHGGVNICGYAKTYTFNIFIFNILQFFLILSIISYTIISIIIITWIDIIIISIIITYYYHIQV